MWERVGPISWKPRPAPTQLNWNDRQHRPPFSNPTVRQMASRHLDDVVRVLDEYRQRATYGAVADVVGSGPQSVMGRTPRTPFCSWVVNAKSGLPTGYSPEECHPMLRSRSPIIADGRALHDWLKRPE